MLVYVGWLGQASLILDLRDKRNEGRNLLDNWGMLSRYLGKQKSSPQDKNVLGESENQLGDPWICSAMARDRVQEVGLERLKGWSRLCTAL